MLPEQYIEVRRIVSNDEKVNIESRPEVIEVGKIKSFRAWHKGNKDRLIKGEITILVMKSDKVDPERKIETMLIEEAYSDFIDRMSAKVIVKRLIE